MKVTVKLFGEFREAVGRDRVELEVPAGTTCGQALRQLAKLEPQVGKLLFTGEGKVRDHLHVFVNGRNVATLQGLDTRLADGDVVSFFPPIGGG
ncbi:MoaD/ThiS family protein [Candidatus Bipolaricaulota bacterium]|nr:MoaD/ThiS family protein [Candidatus Bipolaricaulota bacterium]